MDGLLQFLVTDWLGQDAERTRDAFAKLRRIGGHEQNGDAVFGSKRPADFRSSCSITQVQINERNVGLRGKIHRGAAIRSNTDSAITKLFHHMLDLDCDEYLVLNHKYLACHVLVLIPAAHPETR